MILHGNAIDMLRTLPDESVQLCVTSPPYWSLRDYKIPPVMWGGDEACKHVIGADSFCSRCGAWRGQLGLEPTIGMWVENLVAVFDEVRRVLKGDGVLFVNVGDSYSGSGRGGNPTPESSRLQGGQSSQQASMIKRGLQGATGQRADRRHTAQIAANKPSDGLREKNLIGQPWRLAFALQDAGWYWRDTICWHKLNPMPSSVEDRCTPAWEPLLMFSKSPRYYWNKKAIEEPASNGTHPRTGRAAGFDRSGNAVAEHVIPGQSAAQHRARGPGNKTHKGVTAYEAGDEHHRTKAGLVDYAKRQRASVKRGGFNGKTNALPGREPFRAVVDFRNKRNVWSIASEPTSDAHFAGYPTALVRPCVLAASRPGDTVLDPFSGRATTGVVAIEYGREYIGIELNEAYVAMSRKRLSRATIGLPLESAA